MITKFKIFEEYRIADNAVIIGSGLTYNTDNNYTEEDFLEFITFNIREDGKKLRYDIKWNHKKSHDLIDKLKEKTSMKNSTEFKIFTRKFLNELFDIHYSEINRNGDYSLWLSEYNLSFIININHRKRKLFFVTFFNGMVSNNVINIIELKSSL